MKLWRAGLLAGLLLAAQLSWADRSCNYRLGLNISPAAERDRKEFNLPPTLFDEIVEKTVYRLESGAPVVDDFMIVYNAEQTRGGTADHGYKVVVVTDEEKGGHWIHAVKPVSRSIQHYYFEKLAQIERLSTQDFALPKPIMGCKKVEVDPPIIIKLREKHGVKAIEIREAFRNMVTDLKRDTSGRYPSSLPRYTFLGKNAAGRVLYVVIAHDRATKTFKAITAYYWRQ